MVYHLLQTDNARAITERTLAECDRVKSLRMEILLNIILFIPVGLLSPRWKTVGLAAGYSMLIELAQLVSLRGLFEFDDVMYNALGTALGVLLVLGLKRLRK